jgi:hypothetical protein
MSLATALSGLLSADAVAAALEASYQASEDLAEQGSDQELIAAAEGRRTALMAVRDAIQHCYNRALQVAP